MFNRRPQATKGQGRDPAAGGGPGLLRYPGKWCFSVHGSPRKNFSHAPQSRLRWPGGTLGGILVGLALLGACGGLVGAGFAQTASSTNSRQDSLPTGNGIPDAADTPANMPLSVESGELPRGLLGGPREWTSPEGLSSALQILVLLTVLSLVPAILLMTTCFVRIVVVLGLLRQAIGAQNLPPSQVITGLSLFLTLLIMTPVWKETYDRAVVPYTQRQIGLEEAWNQGIAPIRRFMSLQIERTGNQADVYLFLKYSSDQSEPVSYDEVSLGVLLPAFMLSELKTAFLIGFQLYLPFMIIDMVVSSVMVSMGMLMLPPVMISMPLKLLLFVLVDGWRLVVGMLLESFQPYG